MTIINTVGILLLVLLALEWRRAGSQGRPATEATTTPPAPEEVATRPDEAVVHGARRSGPDRT